MCLCLNRWSMGFSSIAWGNEILLKCLARRMQWLYFKSQRPLLFTLGHSVTTSGIACAHWN